MTRRQTFLPTLAACVALTACGGDGNPVADDEPLPPDAPAAADVVEVDCGAASVAATVTTAGFAYSPATAAITVGQVVRFAPMDGHDVAGDGNPIDVPLAGEGCYRFDAAGTYGFFCSPHGFTGTVEVAP